MNDFEKKIREAMAVSRGGMPSHLPSSATLVKTAAELAALSAGARALNTRLQPTDRGVGLAPESRAGESEPREEPGIVPGSDACLTPPPRTQSGVNRTALSKPGVMMGHWNNPTIAAAIPVLLQVERLRDRQQHNPAAVRAQIVREIQQFQRTLLANHVAREDVDRLAYLLCSWVDECCMSKLESGELNLSLLVEFYHDAWGGEKCFDHLQEYLAASPRNQEILAFYDLILSLGLEGQFRVMERGAVLLADVRNHLDGYLYGQNPTLSLASAEAGARARSSARITPFRLLCFGLIIAALAYSSAAWYLHDQSRTLRNAILAWSPPAPRKINIMETLPQPLPQILSEGWLEVRPDPRGWLLIFTSDGAFAVGRSTLSEAFIKRRNIERLGEALAPWPGDLEVIGHTDNKPYRNSSGNSNLKLSESRAQVVADRLREALAGSKQSRQVTSVGKGDAEPLDDNATEEGRSRNRRVDILWKIGDRERTSPPAAFGQPGEASGVSQANDDLQQY